jgi:alkanesulfonate monooxygenase SsuD/methylene tetrahydromethanopterin reductase-like flavin-dependent oxidoreductase (luciferase family)
VAVDEKFQSSAKATFFGGAGVGTLDPLVAVAAMASVSKNVSFGVTGSTSYINVGFNNEIFVILLMM